MRVVLYHPRAAEERFRIPLSVLSVAAVCPRPREVEIIDGDLHADPLPVLRRALGASREPVVLGVSVMPGPQLARAIPHTRVLRREFPNASIVWGGWFPSLHADTCLRSPMIDYVVRGRAETSFPLLLEAVAGRRSFRTVPGLSYREGGRHCHNPEAAPPHPDEIPPLPLELLPIERYHQRTFLGEKTTAYHTSFGCPLRCGFCAVASLNRGRWLAQSVPKMMSEIDRLLEFGADALELVDNNFFVNEERTLAFSREIQKRGIHWWGEGTIDGILRYHARTLAAMADSGCRMIFFGAESGSDEVLRQMNKGGLKTSSTLELARRLKPYGIVPEFSFVLGNPAAPRQDIEASIELIRRLKAISPECEIILYLYDPEPFEGSELWKSAQKSGYGMPSTLEAWEAGAEGLFQLRRAGKTPWLSAADVRRVRAFETVLAGRFPGVSDIRLGTTRRRILQLLAAPRYRFRFYRAPLEISLALKLSRLRRVEQEGL